MASKARVHHLLNLAGAEDELLRPTVWDTGYRKAPGYLGNAAAGEIAGAGIVSGLFHLAGLAGASRGPRAALPIGPGFWG